MTTPDTHPQIIIAREGRAGRLTLNRPDALNALNYPMVGAIDDALRKWIGDPDVELVILDGAGDRALCAGGDVRAIYDNRDDDGTFGGTFWRDEYHLNALISRFPKPFVAIMDGIVMGGGIGLSAHASHRIVTDRSMLAMPETGIGLIPDVGGTWLLGRAQGELGTYLALTGARMTGSDAIQVGLADSYVPSVELPALISAICRGGRGQLDDIISDFEITIPSSDLAANRSQIDDWFGFDSLHAIMDRLNSTTNELAQKTRAELKLKSPKSLVLTLAALRGVQKMTSLEEALNVEYRLVTRLLADGEFIEGVRALLVDKDKRPRWSPDRLEDLSPELVERFFQPLSGTAGSAPGSPHELGLKPPA